MKGIVDSTLREGEQTPGVIFSLEEKIAIINFLELLGIEEIELGIATKYDQQLPLLIKSCRTRPGQSRLALWCRCKPDDIQYAAELGPDVLSLSIPASDLHITEKLGKSRAWTLNRLSASIKQARALGFHTVSVGLEDATRADEDFLLQLVSTAARTGADRIRIADTVGIASPNAISTLVQKIKKHCSLEIGVHTHNDFGMATANAVSALEAGAHWADATVLGLGERAGNCRLEEITGYLALGGDRRPYHIKHLRTLCLTVARAAEREVPPNHPLVGESIFTCETGLHLQGLNINPATYEPYEPEEVGISRKLLLGRKAGKKAVRHRLDALGCTMPEEKTEQTVLHIRDQAARSRRPLNDEEILAIANNHLPTRFSCPHNS